MFEGDLDEGELEIGQVAALIHEVKSAAAIMEEIIEDYTKAKDEIHYLTIG
jgi:enoyl-[acyl-carrier protein] reductase II